MAKKVKPVAVNDVEISQTDPIVVVPETNTPVKAVKENITADAILDAKPDPTDIITGLESANARLADENDMLKTKIAEYISELESLKNAKSSTPANDSSDELDALRKENDEYLMKISELTFELAKIKAQTSSPKNTSSVCPSHREIVNPYNGFRNSNGYSDWN